MAMETVQAVRQAEFEAVNREKVSAEESDVMISKAEIQAQALLSSMKKSEQEKADKNINMADEKAKELMKISLQQAEQDIICIRKMVEGKEQEAISLVLSEII